MIEKTTRAMGVAINNSTPSWMTPRREKCKTSCTMPPTLRRSAGSPWKTPWLGWAPP
jgi:hypothetical protein